MYIDRLFMKLIKYFIALTQFATQIYIQMLYTHMCFSSCQSICKLFFLACMWVWKDTRVEACVKEKALQIGNKNKKKIAPFTLQIRYYADTDNRW